jgi:double-stranded uracil-DNA glycosylase
MAPLTRSARRQATGRRPTVPIRADGGVLPPLPDRIRPGVRVLFVGINPGIRSSLTGHHFAGVSNRFWPLLYDAGLVPERLTFEDDDRLPVWGYGITNIVSRPTRGSADLRPEEYARGRVRLRRLVRRHRPQVLALVGVTVFRAFFPGHRGAVPCGPRTERVEGAELVVLPNPSGRNAHFSYAGMLAAFRTLAPSRGAYGAVAHPPA